MLRKYALLHLARSAAGWGHSVDLGAREKLGKESSPSPTNLNRPSREVNEMLRQVIYSFVGCQHFPLPLRCGLRCRI